MRDDKERWHVGGTLPGTGEDDVPEIEICTYHDFEGHRQEYLVGLFFDEDDARLGAAAPALRDALKDARRAISRLHDDAMEWAHDGPEARPVRRELLAKIDEALAAAEREGE